MSGGVPNGTPLDKPTGTHRKPIGSPYEAHRQNIGRPYEAHKKLIGGAQTAVFIIPAKSVHSIDYIRNA